VELLLYIFENVPIACLPSAIASCSALYAICIPILYRDVHVQGFRARRFFLTIANDNQRAYAYAIHTKSLNFIGDAEDEDGPVYPLFIKALEKLSRLENLRLFVSPHRGHVLCRLFEKRDIFALGHHSSLTTFPMCQFACLKFLSVGGCQELVRMLCIRNLTTLHIDHPIDVKVLHHWQSVNDNENAQMLQRLSIMLKVDPPTGVVDGLRCLSVLFPHLSYLSVRSTVVNALVSYLIHISTSTLMTRPDADDLVISGR
jgi:hypothetical protein